MGSERTRLLPGYTLFWSDSVQSTLRVPRSPLLTRVPPHLYCRYDSQTFTPSTLSVRIRCAPLFFCSKWGDLSLATISTKHTHFCLPFQCHDWHCVRTLQRLPSLEYRPHSILPRLGGLDLSGTVTRRVSIRNRRPCRTLARRATAQVKVATVIYQNTTRDPL